MNSKQRRKTYRRLRKLMRDKVPVVYRMSYSGTKKRVGLIQAVFMTGMALLPATHPSWTYLGNKAVAARNLKPIPRCRRVTI